MQSELIRHLSTRYVSDCDITYAYGCIFRPYDKYDRVVFMNALVKIPAQQRDIVIGSVILTLLQDQRHLDCMVEFLSAICSLRSETCPADIKVVAHMFWYEEYFPDFVRDIVMSHKSFITNKATPHLADLPTNKYFPNYARLNSTSLRGLPVVIRHLKQFRNIRIRKNTDLFHYYCKYVIRIIGDTIYDNVFAYWLHNNKQFIKHYIGFVVFAAMHADYSVISVLNKHTDAFIVYIQHCRFVRHVSNATIKIFRALIYNGINIYAANNNGVTIASSLAECYDVNMASLIDAFNIS